MSQLEIFTTFRKTGMQVGKTLYKTIEEGSPESMGTKLADIFIDLYKQMEKLAREDFGSAGHLEFVLGVQEKLNIAMQSNTGPRLEACPNEYCPVSRSKQKEVGIPCHICGARNEGDKAHLYR